jgi:hypothetical protein
MKILNKSLIILLLLIGYTTINLSAQNQFKPYIGTCLSDCIIKSAMKTPYEIVGHLDAYTSVEVNQLDSVYDNIILDRWEYYYYVRTYSGLSGYVEKSNIESKAKIEKRQREAKARDERNKVLHLNEMIAKYGSVTGKRIADGTIWIGMTDKMCRDSWGNPNHLNRTVTANGVHEQWVYDHQSTYIYFEDGICTSYQQEK